MRKAIITLGILASIAMGLNAETFTQTEEPDDFTTYFLLEDLPKCPKRTDIGSYSTVYSANFEDSMENTIKQGMRLQLLACKDKKGIQVKLESIYYGVGYEE